MMTTGETMIIDHGTPKQVELSLIEEELEAMRGESDAPEGPRRSFARALTLAIFCDRGDLPEVMDKLVGHIITRYSARAILIRAEPDAEQGHLEAWIRTHCVAHEEGEMQLCAEQITLHARGDSVQLLHNSVLNLRLGNLPLVVWWRGQPDMDNPLFLDLMRSGDQVILDSASFSAPALQLGGLAGRLYREFGHVAFGDINWARLMPWRELVAQFFDNPEHLIYLKQLSEIAIEYSARDDGNPAQAILLTMWLASMLGWQVAAGSWRSSGKNRSFQIKDGDREIHVEIRGREDVDAKSGWLDSVTLKSATDPAATFQIVWCGEDCATTRVNIGERAMERMAVLKIPDEVELVCSEFDASQRDRVYHHALRNLEQLLA
jgi:glucose-6-phosphate dehydrogenase assembly protein OpcA